MSKLDNTRPKESVRLRRMYWQAGMSQREIASALNTSRDAVRRAMDKYDIERRVPGGGQYKKYARFTYDRGYAVWKTTESECRVHQFEGRNND